MEIIEVGGLSILIPIYNSLVTQLVEELANQGSALGIPFEIICYDDFSELQYKEKNRPVKNFDFVKYLELEENIGRSRIRNLLANNSHYTSLLFLDCDSTICNKNFLKDYWKLRENPVVVGGRSYALNAPGPDYTLHWLVGINRETSDAAERNKSPYKSFMFNNVLIKKRIFITIQLDENITTYGHEDTKFGYMLEKKEIPVFHTANPAIHTGLDETEAFLKKTIEGVINLHQLSLQGFGNDTKLVRYFRLLKTFFATDIFLFFYTHFIRNKVQKNLRSSHPSLFFFDLYKLAAFIKVAK